MRKGSEIRQASDQNGLVGAAMRRYPFDVDFRSREYFRRFAAVYLVVAPVLALIILPWAPKPVIGGLIVMHGLLLSPSFFLNGSWFGPVIREFLTQEKEIFLTLDDGPDQATTPRVLELLTAYNAKACFFVIGRKVRQNPELAREIIVQGHELGNHTDTHREWWFWARLWRGIAVEMDGCGEAIAQATGRRPCWFRSPAGLTNPYLFPVARARGLLLLGWTGRARDAGSCDPHVAAVRVLKTVKPGAVIVLHPEQKAADGNYPGLACLEIVLAELQARGYRCVLPDPICAAKFV